MQFWLNASDFVVLHCSHKLMYIVLPVSLMNIAIYVVIWRFNVHLPHEKKAENLHEKQADGEHFSHVLWMNIEQAITLVHFFDETHTQRERNNSIFVCGCDSCCCYCHLPIGNLIKFKSNIQTEATQHDFRIRNSLIYFQLFAINDNQTKLHEFRFFIYST